MMINHYKSLLSNWIQWKVTLRILVASCSLVAYVDPDGFCTMKMMNIALFPGRQQSLSFRDDLPSSEQVQISHQRHKKGKSSTQNCRLVRDIVLVPSRIRGCFYKSKVFIIHFTRRRSNGCAQAIGGGFLWWEVFLHVILLLCSSIWIRIWR